VSPEKKGEAAFSTGGMIVWCRRIDESRPDCRENGGREKARRSASVALARRVEPSSAPRRGGDAHQEGTKYLRKGKAQYSIPCSDSGSGSDVDDEVRICGRVGEAGA